jgi:hypothetical protein
MPLVILHHLLKVSVQLANRRGLKKIYIYTHDKREKQTATDIVGSSHGACIKGGIYLVAMLGGSLPLEHGASSGCGWRNGLQLWRVAANILKKQLRTKDKGWSSSFEVGCGANNPSQ